MTQSIHFDDSAPARVRDGSPTTHSDMGTAGDYRFYAARCIIRTAGGERMTLVDVALFRNGRQLPETQLVDLRAAIAKEFRERVRAYAAAL